MDLRYRLAVVTGAGSGLGREIAVALSRVGAAVLSVDRDLTGAEGTAALVREARVGAWALQVDPADEGELRILAARARDLGGMDLLVHLDLDLGAPTLLTQLFVAGLVERRGRRDGTPALVNVGSSAAKDGLVRFTTSRADPASAGGARVMAVVPGRTGLGRGHAPWAALPRHDGQRLPPPTPPAEVTRAVVELLSRGAAGEVVELGGG